MYAIDIDKKGFITLYSIFAILATQSWIDKKANGNANANANCNDKDLEYE